MNKEWLDTHQLQEIRLIDYEVYSKYMKITPYFTGLWASNFTYIWSLSQLKSINVYWKIIDDMLVTFVLTRKNFMFVWCLPFGKCTPKHILRVVKESLALCRQWNSNHFHKRQPFIHLLNRRQVQFLSKSRFFRKIFITKKLKATEYLWDIPKIIELKGKDFREIRGNRNRILRAHPSIQIRAYVPEDYEEVMHVKNVWNKTAGQKYKSITDANLFQQVLQHYKALHEWIYVVTINEKIVAVVTGAILPNGLSWGCAAKALPGYKGLYEYLYTEFISIIHKIQPEIEILHVGSDNNHEGLRKFKEKFRPLEKLSLYSMKLR